MNESDQDQRIWKALSDPCRRAILDRLRARPHTTGELAEQFPFTRFAVMKHLVVLVEAGLILVERRGRKRINHLHPLPLQRLLRRWVHPVEEAAAQRLQRAASSLEQERAKTRTEATEPKPPRNTRPGTSRARRSRVPSPRPRGKP